MEPIAKKDMEIAEDALISDVQFLIHNVMSAKDVTRSELARRLDVSEPYVSQLFKDNTRNLTLKTVARIFYALGEEVRITSESFERITQPKLSLHAAKRANSICSMLRIVTTNEFQLQCNDNDNGFDLAA